MTAAGYALVVDDEADIRDTVAVLLGLYGLRAVTAGNGREALDYLRTHPAPAVILLDLLMPVMGGEQFLAERAKAPTLAAVPVVVCSATAGSDRRADRDQLLGVAGYLDKPADPTVLVATVRRFLDGTHTS